MSLKSIPLVSSHRVSRRTVIGAAAGAALACRTTGGPRAAASKAPLPVIVIPGVLGTRLRWPDDAIPDWDADAPPAFFAWATINPALKLQALSVERSPEVALIADAFAPPSPGSPGPEGDEVLAALAAADGVTIERFAAGRGWLPLSWDTYGRLLVTLESTLNRGGAYPVYGFGYDWRQSNRLTATRFAGFLDAVLARHPGARRAAVVAHSMGGFVARAAILDAATAAKIAGVTYIAHPANGAVVAYRRFLTGARPPYDGGQDGDFAGRLADILFNAVMGETPEEYAAVISGLPGPVELLPNDRYHRFAAEPWLRTDPPANLDRIYDLYTAPGPASVIPPDLVAYVNGVAGAPAGVDIERDLRARVEGARDFQAAVAGVTHPASYVVYGTGLKTDHAVDLTDPSGLPVVEQTAAGDNTVDAVSGACPGWPDGSVRASVAFPGMEHAGMVGVPIVMAKIIDVLREIAADH